MTVFDSRVNEYYVVTECKRNFVWSATDYEDLINSLRRGGYKATFILPYHEWLQRQEDPSIA